MKQLYRTSIVLSLMVVLVLSITTVSAQRGSRGGDDNNSPITIGEWQQTYQGACSGYEPITYEVGHDDTLFINDRDAGLIPFTLLYPGQYNALTSFVAENEEVQLDITLSVESPDRMTGTEVYDDGSFTETCPIEVVLVNAMDVVRMEEVAVVTESSTPEDVVTGTTPDNLGTVTDGLYAMLFFGDCSDQRPWVSFVGTTMLGEMTVTNDLGVAVLSPTGGGLFNGQVGEGDDVSSYELSQMDERGFRGILTFAGGDACPIELALLVEDNDPVFNEGPADGDYAVQYVEECAELGTLSESASIRFGEDVFGDESYLLQVDAYDENELRLDQLGNDDFTTNLQSMTVGEGGFTVVLALQVVDENRIEGFELYRADAGVERFCPIEMVREGATEVDIAVTEEVTTDIRLTTGVWIVSGLPPCTQLPRVQVFLDHQGDELLSFDQFGSAFVLNRVNETELQGADNANNDWIVQPISATEVAGNVVFVGGISCDFTATLALETANPNAVFSDVSITPDDDTEEAISPGGIVIAQSIWQATYTGICAGEAPFNVVLSTDGQTMFVDDEDLGLIQLVSTSANNYGFEQFLPEFNVTVNLTLQVLSDSQVQGQIQTSSNGSVIQTCPLTLAPV